MGYDIEKHGVPLDFTVEKDQAELAPGEDRFLTVAKALLTDQGSGFRVRLPRPAQEAKG